VNYRGDSPTLSFLNHLVNDTVVRNPQFQQGDLGSEAAANAFLAYLYSTGSKASGGCKCRSIEYSC